MAELLAAFEGSLWETRHKVNKQTNKQTNKQLGKKTKRLEKKARALTNLHGIFGWNFWDKWNSLFLPLKTGQDTMLYHLSKNDPIELSSLGRLVPRFTKSSTVGERMARVRFLQMVQLIPVTSVETKNQEYLRRHSFYSGNFSPG